MAAASVLLSACSGGDGKPFVSLPATIASVPPTTALAQTTAPATAAPAPLVWKPRADAPTARQEVAAAVLDGKVWVVGGLTDAGASARVETYDPATDRWAAGPDLPVALHHLAVVAYRGEIVVASGFLGGGSDLYSRPTDRVLALRAGAWVDLPKLRRPRGAAAAAVAGDLIVLAGGRDSGLLIGPTEVFDGTAWQDRAPIPTLRDHLATASDGRVVYAAGGRALSPSAMFDVMERYDPGRDAWERLPSLPTARGGLGLTLLSGRLIAAGGESASVVYPEVEAFDIARGAWSTLPPAPTPRHGLALVTAGPSVYSLVGGTEAGVAPSKVTEVLTAG